MDTMDTNTPNLPEPTNPARSWFEQHGFSPNAGYRAEHLYSKIQFDLDKLIQEATRVRNMLDDPNFDIALFHAQQMAYHAGHSGSLPALAGNVIASAGMLTGMMEAK